MDQLRAKGRGGGADDGDGERIARILRGEEAALAELYDRYGGLMLGVALRILPTREAAEDIVHDVFLEAWRSAESYDPARGSVRSWLLIRLRSRCLDRRRLAQNARAIPVADLRALDRPEAPEEAADLSPDRARVRAALARMSADQRAVLELAYFEGLTSAEIAGRVGVPIGTVKSRMAAAIGRLQAAIGAGGAA